MATKSSILYPTRYISLGLFLMGCGFWRLVKLLGFRKKMMVTPCFAVEYHLKTFNSS